jgi:hypothetical protein
MNMITLATDLVQQFYTYSTGIFAVVGEVPTKRSSDHDPMIRHCRIIGRFES